VGHSFAFIDDIDDRRTGKLAGVEWLSAGGRIERGPIKVNAPAFVKPADDRGFEVTQI
jgi:hypothetical protein